MKSRLSAFLGTLAGLAALTTNAGAQDIPPCRISGKLGPDALASYALYSQGFSWLTFSFPVTDIEVKGITLTPDLPPFVEFSLRVLEDGSYAENYWSTLYLGDAYSASTGDWVDIWATQAQFNGTSGGGDAITVKGTSKKYTDYPSRFGLIGGLMTSPAQLIEGIRDKTPLTVTARNKDNPDELVNATIDAELFAKYFALMEQQEAIVRKQAADGGCAPV